jgi:DNA-binding CsgD family transcriptional regulator
MDPAAANAARLSPREREVLQLLGEGKTSKEVAVMLGMTLKTARKHRGNVMLKLKLHSIAELVLYAVRNEIVHVQLPEGLRSPNPIGVVSQRIH